MTFKRRIAKRVGKFKSGLEKVFAEGLAALGVTVKYEPLKIPYVVEAFYLPDFELPNGVLIETKGWFPSEDRKKIRLVTEQHPDKDIRMVFSNPATKIAKGSKTTYADWCDKHNIKWAKHPIPLAWIKEQSK